MKLNPLPIAILGIIGLVISGCVGTLDDRHTTGLVGKDTVVTRYNRTPAQLWAAAKEVIDQHGTLTSADTLRNVLEGTVDQRRIWIKVEEYDIETSRLRVQARGQSTGDVEMAAFIDKQIAVHLAAENLTPPRAR